MKGCFHRNLAFVFIFLVRWKDFPGLETRFASGSLVVSNFQRYQSPTPRVWLVPPIHLKGNSLNSSTRIYTTWPSLSTSRTQRKTQLSIAPVKTMRLVLFDRVHSSILGFRCHRLRTVVMFFYLSEPPSLRLCLF